MQTTMRSFGLRTRIILIGLIAVAPVLVALVALQRTARERSREAAVAEGEHMAQAAASAQADLLDDTRLVLLGTAGRSTMASPSERECGRALESVRQNRPDYLALFSVAPDGALRCMAGLLSVAGLSREGRSLAVRAVESRRPVTAAIHVEVAGPLPLLMVAQPIIGDSGRVVSVLVAVLRLAALERRLLASPLGVGATMTVFDNAGTVLARTPDAHRWVGARVPVEAVLTRLRAGAVVDWREEDGVDGVKRIYVTTPIVGTFATGLYLGLGVTHAATYADSDRIVWRFAALALLVGLSGVAATSVAARSFILRPAKAIKSVTKRLAAGDLGARAELSRVAGMTELGAAINEMAAALEDRQRERDAATEELRASEREMRTVGERKRFALEAVGAGVWEANLVTGTSYWSSTCETMNGLAPGTFGGSIDAYMQTVHEDDRARVQDAADEAIRQRGRMQAEYRAVRPDGTTRRIRTIGQVYCDASRKPIRMVGVLLDVTDQRNAEEQLLQSQRLEAVGQLAGGIAHDFNNLLMVIDGNTDLAMRALPATSATHADLQQVRDAAARAARLTSQLLAFSRKQVLHAAPVDVDDLVDHVAPMIARLIGEDIDVHSTLSGVRPITIVDRGQLEQALINLALNSRDAMPRGGRLSVTTAAVWLDETTIAHRHLPLEPGSYVALSVADTGEGMTPEILARAFEPFFTTKEVGKGTGLGLSSVYGTVKQTGGHVVAESAPGHGTTVTMYLPRLGADELVQPDGGRGPLVATPSAQSEVTILLVEDEPAVRDIIDRVLTRAGYLVVSADCGAAALECATRGNLTIDLVLSDVVMPGISVTEMVAGLRAIWPTVPLMLMSGYPDGEIARRGLPTEHSAVVEKPISPAALLEKIHHVLHTATPTPTPTGDAAADADLLAPAFA